MNRWKKVFIIVVGSWLAVVLAYRFVAPPATPLMFIRYLQAVSGSDSPKREWKWIPLSSISRPAQQVIVAAEDARFMDHWGIDLSAVGDVLDGSERRSRWRGASTITMQTVKNLFLWPGRSYIRKAIEAVMAPVAGLVWGKRRTLEIYLNVVEWGDGIYGIEAAAQRYFRTSASQLTVQQAAALAAILPNPRKFSPHILSASSRRRVDRIMREWQAVRIPTSGSRRERPRRA